MNKIQFSKTIIRISFLITIIGIIIAVAGSIFFDLDEVVSSAIVAATGCLGSTSIIWYLKKAQAENTIKIYLTAYKEILNLKKEMNEDVSETFEQMEDNILGKMDNKLSEVMDEATSTIEKQEIY